MKRFIYKTFFAATAVMLAMTACKKDDTQLPITDSDVSSATDNMVVQETFQDVAATTQEAFNGNISGRIAGDTCVVITKDTVNSLITVDFGSGCTNSRNIVRSGKLLISYTGGEFQDSGCHIDVTFDNFYHNGKKVEGTKSFDNKGKVGGNQVVTIKVINGKITFADGKYVSLNSDKTFEFVSGFSTKTVVDDVIGISGSASGVGKDGASYTEVIKQQLLRDNTCIKPQFTKGVLEYTPGTKATRVIDFGNGDCDGKGKITIGGFSTDMDLK